MWWKIGKVFFLDLVIESISIFDITSTIEKSF